MNILGIGIMFGRGRNVNALRVALRDGWRAPTAPPAHTVSEEALEDRTVLVGNLRRADRFSRLAVLAATDALADAHVVSDPAATGLVIGTAFGPHVMKFRFEDEILTHGDSAVSPTIFSHTVHNVAAAYVGLACGVRGPCATVTHFSLAFHHALLIAQCWIEEGRCSRVLVGCVDELGAVANYIWRMRRRLAANGRLRPFAAAADAVAAPSEGACFLLLAQDQPALQPYGRIGSVGVGALPSVWPSDTARLVLDADGSTEDETGYLALAGIRRLPVSAFAPLWGSLPATGSAFSLAAVATMAADGHIWPVPVADNPHGLNLSVQDDLTRAMVCRLGCHGEAGWVDFQKKD
jgi:3-oxoacyl-[acyl-carrier-protein] synthase II